MLRRYNLYTLHKLYRLLPARRWNHSLNAVTSRDLEHFAKILPSSSILSTLPPSSSSVDDLSTYNVDWMGKYFGHSPVVLKPKSTEEVSGILKWCWERRLAVVPQGGNTGLVGGSVPLKDEIVISLGNMNNVRSFDPVTGLYFCIMHIFHVFTPRNIVQVFSLRMLDVF